MRLLHPTLLNISLDQPILCLWKEQINEGWSEFDTEYPFFVNALQSCIASKQQQHISEQDSSNYFRWIDVVSYFFLGSKFCEVVLVSVVNCICQIIFWRAVGDLSLRGMRCDLRRRFGVTGDAGRAACQELTERSEAAAVHFSPTHADDTDTLLLALRDTGQWQILIDSWYLKWNFSEVETVTGLQRFLTREEESLKAMVLGEAEALGLSKPCRTLPRKTEAALECSCGNDSPFPSRLGKPPPKARCLSLRCLPGDLGWTHGTSSAWTQLRPPAGSVRGAACH